MCKAVRVPREKVYISYKSAHCEDCGSGRGIWEEENKEFHTGFHNPENELLVDTSCSCGGIYQLKEGYWEYASPAHYLVKCKCSLSISIYRDGQQCSCGQYYNGVGQPITHVGYDSFGDTDSDDY